jgi:hypothetical protein
MGLKFDNKEKINKIIRLSKGGHLRDFHKTIKEKVI